MLLRIKFEIWQLLYLVPVSIQLDKLLHVHQCTGTLGLISKSHQQIDRLVNRSL